ncbi:MAG: AsmA family protein [Rhodospirillales bacterium]|nr:AsmA family protein [Rhodospirillales bacterium]
MKRIFIGLFGALIMLVALALAAPSFVDWTQYKDAVAREVQRVTGRDIVIGGDLDLRLLPGPAVTVEDLRLANAAGRPDPYMLRLARADIRIEPGALFGGRIRFAEVRLIDPVVLIEVLADGRLNWDGVRTRQSSESSLALPVSGSGNGAAAAPWDGSLVRLDSIEIENGTVIIRNEAEGTVERIGGLTANLAARSLSGPFEGKGRLRYGDAALAFELALGDVSGSDPVPLRLAVADSTGTGGQVRGTLLGLGDAAPRLQGHIEGSSADLAAFLAERFDMHAPAFLAQAATFSGTLEAAAVGAEVRALSLTIGDSRASGTAAVAFGTPPHMQLDLRATRLDLDAWLAMPAPGQPRPAQPQPRAERTRSAAARLLDGLTASIDLKVDALTYRDGIIRQMEAGGDFADGTLFVRQMSALIPGAAEVALEGSVRWEPTATVRGAPTAPRFEGRAAARSDDLRGVLRWLGLDRDDLPRQHLRSVTLKTALSASPQHIAADDLTAQLDGSTVAGRVIWSPEDSPPLVADLSMDRLTLDGLLPSSLWSTATAQGGTVATGGRAGAASPDGAGETEAEVPANPALDLRLRVGALGYRGARMETVVFDGALGSDRLLLRRLSVGDVAGASGWISGVVSTPAERPRFDGLNFEFSATDPARLLPVLAMEVPKVARAVGPVAGSGRLSGTADQAALDLSLTVAGAFLQATGDVAAFDGEPRFVGRATLRHDDLTRMIAALGGAPPARAWGPTNVSGSVTADRKGVSAAAIEGTVAGVRMTGSANVNFAAPRPRIDAELAAGRIVIDRFLSATDDQASLRKPMPASSAERRREDPPASGTRGATQPNWSRIPFDFGVLTAIDGRLMLDAEAIAYGATALEAARLQATLADGRLTIADIAGRLWDGAFTASGHVSAAGVPAAVDMTAELSGADLRRVSAASAEDSAARAVSAGRGDVDLRLAASGQSTAELVSRLQGSGRLTLTDVVVTDAAAAGTAPLFRILKALDQAGALLRPAAAPASGADVSATARVEDGIVRSDDLSIVLGWARGEGRGVVDLPAWMIDMAGGVTMAPEVWRQLAVDVVADLGRIDPPQRIDFTVSGPIDDADVRIRIESLPTVTPTPGGEGLQRGLGPLTDPSDSPPGVLETPP